MRNRKNKYEKACIECLSQGQHEKQASDKFVLTEQLPGQLPAAAVNEQKPTAVEQPAPTELASYGHALEAEVAVLGARDDDR